MDTRNVKELLDRAVERINTPEFIVEDPVQFPRRFIDAADIEIAALLSASIAWGRRPQILKDCEKILGIMGGEPAAYVRSGEWRSLPDDLNIHRTCKGAHLKWYMAGLQRIYAAYGTLEAFALAKGATRCESPAWALAAAMGGEMLEANDQLRCPEMLPSNLKTTALKRLNMALRWLVRRDGIVDIGLWGSWTSAKLYIPLDVHVGRVSASLGLLSRKSPDRKAVELLTARLREFDPRDPVRYDFALFGLGVQGVEL